MYLVKDVLKESERTKMWSREQLLFMEKQSLFFKPPREHNYFHISSQIKESAGTSLCSAAKYNVLGLVQSLSFILLNSTLNYRNQCIGKLLSSWKEGRLGWQ